MPNDYSQSPTEMQVLWQEMLKLVDPNAVKPEWQEFDRDNQSVTLALYGRKGLSMGLTFGGKNSFTKTYPYLYVQEAPYTEGVLLPTPHERLALVVDYFTTRGYSLIRSINKGRADFMSMAIYTGSMLVFQKDDTIVYFGWTDSPFLGKEPPFPGRK